MDTIKNRTFDEIWIGDTASITHTLAQRDIELFAIMSGDVNPTDVDEAFADRVRFLLKDCWHTTGRYDRIVSVGMFEHVGIGHYREYFEKLRHLLTSDGVALLHTIGCAGGPRAVNPWLQNYIFPGGYTPALSEITPFIECARLYVTDVKVLRAPYAKTLKAWRQRFMGVAKLSLSHMTSGYVECGR